MQLIVALMVLIKIYYLSKLAITKDVYRAGVTSLKCSAMV